MGKSFNIILGLLLLSFVLLNGCRSKHSFEDIQKKVETQKDQHKKQLEKDIKENTITYTKEEDGHKYVITVTYGCSCSMVHSESCPCKKK